MGRSASRSGGARSTVGLAGALGFALGLAGACGQSAPPKTPVADDEGGTVVAASEPEKIPLPPPPPAVRVNQLGYLPVGPKHAAWQSDAATPATWELLDASGKVVASGATVPGKLDADSGQSVHHIDFSSASAEGDGLTLRVGAEQSPPFAIRAGLYGGLVSDALWYFYHNRSGLPIELPYAGDAKWTRPAGHLSDKSVKCSKAAGCDYSLDVSGGWYDAGDHGKYVVNGGISAWTLLSAWERATHLSQHALPALGDGRFRLPEAGNGVSDVLDEARWELEFLMRMQVPEGAPHAGMAHHKIHDVAWTGLPTVPPTETKVPRELRPVSTAATLNLAAVAAQCARVYAKVDAPFAARCRASAERAWKAAQAEPSLLAPAADTTGGGPYSDSRVSDEFYWAAVELFVTTGGAEYRAALEASPFHQRIPTGTHEDGTGWISAMTWQSVSALGTITLAVVPNGLGEAGQSAARAALVQEADRYVALRDAQGYRVPFASWDGKYPWGSSSFVANNALVLALAHDFTGEARYREAVLDGMGYLLGVNALGQSYVTGYGARATQNPHHRFWAHQLSPASPPPPPGALAGGPNSGLEDPIAQRAPLAGCAPQTCYLDHIEAWSLNEIAVNWNAPLFWVAAWLDEPVRPTPAPKR